MAQSSHTASGVLGTAHSGGQTPVVCSSGRSVEAQAQVPLLGRIASASVGSVMTTLMMTPLDVVKTRQQSAPWSGPAAAAAARTPGCVVHSAEAARPAASVAVRHHAQVIAHTHTQTHSHARAFRFRAKAGVSSLGLGDLGRKHSCAVHAPSHRVPRVAVVQATCSQCMRQCHAAAPEVFSVRGGASIVAGAGGAARAVLADVVRAAGPLAAAGDVTAAASARLSTLRTFAQLVRVEGFRSLYSGLIPTLLMAVPNTALYYSLYDTLRTRVKVVGDTAAPLVAGMSARIVAASLISPLELMRTKMQAAGYKHSLLHGMRVEVKKAGVRSLWRGLAPTLWRDVPFSGLYWLSFEKFLSASTRFVRGGLEPDNADPLPFQDAFAAAFIAGAGAGAVSAVATHPFDVMKTQVQVSMHDTGALRPPALTTVARTIIRAQGVRGLFAGLVPRLAKVAPACAVMISTYEVGKMLLAPATTADAYEE